MMFRNLGLFAVLTVCLASYGSLARAGGNIPGGPGCVGGMQDCPPPDQEPMPPPPSPQPNPGPDAGFCSGFYEGWYIGQPGPVSFKIEQRPGPRGELRVTAWWRGGMWYGQGFCLQVAPWQAQVEIYFPGAPAHRGVINADDSGDAVMDGQIDGGNIFRMTRRGW